MPVVDYSCAPRTPQESQWYGRTVLTNFTNCQREKGVFSPIKVSYSTIGEASGNTGTILFQDIIKHNNEPTDVGYCTVN